MQYFIIYYQNIQHINIKNSHDLKHAFYNIAFCFEAQDCLGQSRDLILLSIHAGIIVKLSNLLTTSTGQTDDVSTFCIHI
jgi:hypothetical protein